ncbi:MAG: hypothetical protein P8X39_07885 [Desulfofustis sp.]
MLLVGDAPADNADDRFGDLQVPLLVAALAELFMIHEHRGMDDIEMVGEQLDQIFTDIEDRDLAAGAGTQPF